MSDSTGLYEGDSCEVWSWILAEDAVMATWQESLWITPNSVGFKDKEKRNEF